MVGAMVAMTVATWGPLSVVTKAESTAWTKVVSWGVLSVAQSDAMKAGWWVHRLAVRSAGWKEHSTVAVMVVLLAGTKASSMVVRSVLPKVGWSVDPMGRQTVGRLAADSAELWAPWWAAWKAGKSAAEKATSTVELWVDSKAVMSAHRWVVKKVVPLARRMAESKAVLLVG